MQKCKSKRDSMTIVNIKEYHLFIRYIICIYRYESVFVCMCVYARICLFRKVSMCVCMEVHASMYVYVGVLCTEVYAGLQ